MSGWDVILVEHVCVTVGHVLVVKGSLYRWFVKANGVGTGYQTYRQEDGGERRYDGLLILCNVVSQLQDMLDDRH